MFGYVRPLKGELKVREFEQYKAAYCGLCHSLKDRYGLAARFCVNYDLTFLAMLLSTEERPAYTHRRCLACPFRKKRGCAGSPALDWAAACSLILCWWKLADAQRDGGFFERSKARMGKLFLSRAYKKAARDLPDFAAATERQLAELSQLEKEGCKSLDRTADTFACLLRAAVPPQETVERSRILAELLYHVGRWIYIVDAADDLKADLAAGCYNPLAARFDLSSGELGKEERDWLAATIKHSGNLAAAALELLEEGAWSGILRNILYLGLPTAAELVLEGKYTQEMGRRLK